MTPEDVQKWDVDANLTDTPRDILEFNYHALAKGFVAYAAEIRRQHDAELTRLRNLIDVGQHVTVLMSQAERQGKKTVRIADVLAEAQERVGK